MNESGLHIGTRNITVQAVDALIARVQLLIDSGPEPGGPMAQHVAAAYLGDLPAIGALATIASRRANGS